MTTEYNLTVHAPETVTIAVVGGDERLRKALMRDIGEHLTLMGAAVVIVTNLETYEGAMPEEEFADKVSSTIFNLAYMVQREDGEVYPPAPVPHPEPAEACGGACHAGGQPLTVGDILRLRAESEKALDARLAEKRRNAAPFSAATPR